jgi:hypothetical protein
MVFATIYFQYGVRNPEQPDQHAQLNDLSNKHYHWALTNFFELAIGNTVTAVQALALIAIHTRSFPKPGCSSVIANIALSRAIDLNLHRGLKLPGGGTNIDNEMRKRVWWVTLGLAVTLNGRLGRPMPITLEEFDVEFPLAIADDYITEEGITDPSQIGQCPFLVGLTYFKMVPLYMEMFSNIYSVRRNPEKYVDAVRGLEEGIQALKNNLPDDLKLDKCQINNRVFALYIEATVLEFYLCLRHPSVCMTDDRDFCAENTRICEETAGKLLNVITSLLKIKSLDTTWYQLSVYVAAMFSSLVAHWERRFDTSPAEMATLRRDMKMWMNIVYEIGLTLGKLGQDDNRLLLTDLHTDHTPVGPGARLSHDIGMVVDRTIASIEQAMSGKGAGQPDQQGAPHQPSPTPLQQDVMAPARREQQVTNTSTAEGFGPDDQQRNGTANDNGYYNSGIAHHAATGYGAPVAYGSQATAGGQGSNSNDMPAVGPYDPAESAQYIYAAAATANPASGMDQSASSTNPLIAFASQATAQVSASQPGGETDEWRQPQANLAAAAAAAQAQAHGTNGWHDWTAAIADSQTDRYSANALLNLGAGRPSDGNPAAGLGGGVSISADMGMVGGPSGSAAPHPGQWPLLLFHDGNGTVNGS